MGAGSTLHLPPHSRLGGTVLLTQNENVVLDRRNQVQPEPGHYSAGITRIEKLAEQEVSKHDKLYRDFDAGKYQTTYSLLNHHARLALVMEKVGRARQRTEELVQLGRLAALLHDMGKLHPECQSYRKKQKLSDEERERLTDLHPIFSLDFAEKMLPLIRSEDRVFLSQAFPLIRYHHKPWFIRNPTLREIGYDLMIGDALMAIQESRESEGRGLMDALEIIELWDPCERYPEHEPYVDLIGESKRAVIWLYGLQANMSGEENPFVQG